MMPIQSVADYFIAYSHEVQEPITHLKLQKLVYYAEAWHLSIYAEPLTGERFEAWKRGPVNPTLWFRFKSYGWDPISEAVDLPEIDEHTRLHLDEIIQEYAVLNAVQLEQLTHRELPWLHAREDRGRDESSSRPISVDHMRDFYRDRREQRDLEQVDEALREAE